MKWSKHAPQTVEIHYADIGCMENRQTAEPEQRKEIPKVSWTIPSDTPTENPAGAWNTSRVSPTAVVTPVRGQQIRRAFSYQKSRAFGM